MSLFLSKKPKKPFFNYVPTPLRQWILLIGLFGLKNKKILELVKMVKLVKASGAVAATFSVLASIGFYAVDKGSAFALAFIGVLLTHEAGHVWAIHHLKLGAFWETFFSLRAFPGIGAFIQAPPMASREEEAFIGYGGPLFSTLGGYLLFALWFITPDIKLTHLHHAFLVFAGLFFVGMFYYLTLLKIQPIDRKIFIRSPLWGDVFHQFFSIPLVRKICAHAFLGGVSVIIWEFTTPVVMSARDFVFLAVFVSAVISIFNLVITIRPLDGGRILQIVGSLFAYVGVASLVALTFYIAESSIFLIWMIVLVSLRTHPLVRFYAVVLAGIGLVVFLILGHASQSRFESGVDILLGLWMLSIAYARKSEVWQKDGDRRTLNDANSTEDRRREEYFDRRKMGAPWPVRFKWFLLYVLLLGATLGLAFLIVQFAPPHFKIT